MKSQTQNMMVWALCLVGSLLEACSCNKSHERYDVRDASFDVAADGSTDANLEDDARGPTFSCGSRTCTVGLHVCVEEQLSIEGRHFVGDPNYRCEEQQNNCRSCSCIPSINNFPMTCNESAPGEITVRRSVPGV